MSREIAKRRVWDFLRVFAPSREALSYFASEEALVPLTRLVLLDTQMPAITLRQGWPVAPSENPMRLGV